MIPGAGGAGYPGGNDGPDPNGGMDAPRLSARADAFIVSIQEFSQKCGLPLEEATRRLEITARQFPGEVVQVSPWVWKFELNHMGRIGQGGRL